MVFLRYFLFSCLLLRSGSSVDTGSSEPCLAPDVQEVISKCFLMSGLFPSEKHGQDLASHESLVAIFLASYRVAACPE